MYIVFVLILSITASTFGVDDELWQPEEWSFGPQTHTTRRKTLNIIYTELDSILIKINNNAAYIPIAKFNTIRALLGSWKDVTSIHLSKIESDRFIYNKEDVEQFINCYNQQEPIIVKAVHEIETIIHEAKNLNYNDLNATFLSLSINNQNNDPLDDLISGLSNIGISSQ